MDFDKPDDETLPAVEPVADVDSFDPDAFLAEAQQAVSIQPTAAAVAPQQDQEIADFDPDAFLAEANEEKYGTVGQQAITALEGAAEGTVGLLAPLIETKVLGVDPADILARKETHPITHGVSQALGLGAGLLTGTGEAAIMTKAGKLAMEAAGLGKGLQTASTTYKVGSAFVAQAAEMAVLQSGDEVSKLILKDPRAASESAISNIGLAAALGGATGALYEGAVMPLWNATAGPKVGSLLNGLKDHVNGGSRLILPEETEAAIKNLGIELAPEMRAAISKDPKLVEHFKTLKYAQNPKIMAGLEKVQQDASEAVANSVNMKAADIAEYSESEAGHGLLEVFKKENANKYGPLEAAYAKRNAEAAKIAVADESRLSAYEKLIESGMEKVGTDSPYYKLFDEYGQRILAKDTVGGMDQLVTEINNRIKGLKIGGDYNIINALNNIKGSIRELQEREITRQASILEKEGAEFAGALGKDLNRERAELSSKYAEFAKMSDELTNHLGVGDFYGAKTLENKLENKITAEALLNKFSFKNNADFIPFLAKHFPETLKEVQQNELKRLLKPAFLGAKGENAINVNKLNDILDKTLAGKKEYIEQLLSPEAIQKIRSAKTLIDSIPGTRDSGTAGGLAKVLKNMPASALAAVGALMGEGATGALTGGVTGAVVGEMAHKLGRDAPDAIRLAYLKFMGSDQPIKAEGFKAMVDFFHNTYKGQNVLSKATKNLFKGGVPVLASNLIPDDKDRNTLDKAVIRLRDNPEQVMKQQLGELGHYLPQHQVATTEASIKAFQYLSSIKPKPHTLGILDKPVPPQPSEIARYNRALDIAQQPAIILEHIKNGTLLATDIQDISNLYPGLYNELIQKLTNEMTSLHADNETIPYKTRVSLSLFLGQPLDVSMQPMSIQAAQPKMGAGQQPQQAAPPKGSSTKNLGKLNKSYQTPLQASEADRATRKAH